MEVNEANKREYAEDDSEHVISRSRKRRIARHMADEELDEFLKETSAENVNLESAHKSAADHVEKETLPLSTLDISISEVRFFYFTFISYLL